MSDPEPSTARSVALEIVRGAALLVREWLLDEFVVGLALLGLVVLLATFDADESWVAALDVIVGLAGMLLPSVLIIKRLPRRTVAAVGVVILAAEVATLVLVFHS